MKYIDADKLLDVIAKLHEEHTTREYRDEAALVLEDLEEYIDSLQQEQPEVDIEKEIKELWESLNTGHDYVIVDSYQCFLGICLHCFELGLNANKEDKQ